MAIMIMVMMVVTVVMAYREVFLQYFPSLFDGFVQQHFAVQIQYIEHEEAHISVLELCLLVHTQRAERQGAVGLGVHQQHLRIEYDRVCLRSLQHVLTNFRNLHRISVNYHHRCHCDS